MMEQTVSASEVREKFAEFLESVEKRRVLVQKHGRARAYLISVRELKALEETLEILEDSPLVQSIRLGIVEANEGKVRDANDVFAELDAELNED
jgi:prevent-host-death family protein